MAQTQSRRTAAPAWEQMLAQAVGAPLTPETRRFFDAWRQAEGGTASFNPFNTTQPAPGATSYNSVGVRNYPSLEEGVQATADTLRNGYYRPLLSDLQHGASAVQLARDVAASPWGTGSGVLRVLGAGGAAPAQLPAAASGYQSEGMSPLARAAAVQPDPGVQRRAFASAFLSALSPKGLISPQGLLAAIAARNSV